MSQPYPSLSPTVRVGLATDVPALVRLNQRWQRSQVATTQNGFLGAAFSPAIFAALAEIRQLVVAARGEEIVVYYLLNTVSTDGILATHQQAVAELRQQQQLTPTDLVGIGAQACIDQAYQGTGLRVVMLRQLLAQVTSRYDYLFATISKENSKAFRAHTRDGWQVRGENELVYYVVLPVAQSPIS